MLHKDPHHSQSDPKYRRGEQDDALLDERSELDERNLRGVGHADSHRSAGAEAVDHLSCEQDASLLCRVLYGRAGNGEGGKAAADAGSAEVVHEEAGREGADGLGETGHGAPKTDIVSIEDVYMRRALTKSRWKRYMVLKGQCYQSRERTRAWTEKLCWRCCRIQTSWLPRRRRCLFSSAMSLETSNLSHTKHDRLLEPSSGFQSNQDSFIFLDRVSVLCCVFRKGEFVDSAGRFDVEAVVGLILVFHYEERPRGDEDEDQV